MAAVNPNPAEQMLVIQTAGRMSNGALLPKDARTAATVAGINWMDAVFKPMSLHISSLALAGFLGFFICFTARIPIGVAALPNPRKLAQILAER